MGHLALFLGFAILFAAGAAFAAAGTCTDGTTYGKCSTANPGTYCTGVLAAPTLQPYIDHCPCSVVAGYLQQGVGEDAACVLAKCGSISNGACDPANKPKVCEYGALKDNATKCGCPAGMVKNADAVTCSYPPCNDTGITVANGICSTKTSGKKCINGQLADKASECPCKSGMTKVGEACVASCSDGTLTGACSSMLPKQCVNGYLVDNATKCGCPEGQSAVGTRCGAEFVIDIAALPTLAPNQSALAQQGSGTSNPCCCCPTAVLVGMLGGYVFFRRAKPEDRL